MIILRGGTSLVMFMVSLKLAAMQIVIGVVLERSWCIGFLTSSSSGGAGRGSDYFCFIARKTSGNGDNAGLQTAHQSERTRA